MYSTSLPSYPLYVKPEQHIEKRLDLVENVTIELLSELITLSKISQYLDIPFRL